MDQTKTKTGTPVAKGFLQPPMAKPDIDPDEDAFGKSGGNRNSDYSKMAKFYAAVQAMTAFGRRPCDWMKRDLLAGAAGDDRRNFPLRTLLRNDSTFLEQAADARPPRPFQKQIRELRGFDYFSRRHQLEMQNAMRQGSSAERGAKLASVCPTSLYETKTLIPHRYKNSRKSNRCNNAWVCPHCYARQMARQYTSALPRLEQSGAVYLALLSRECIVSLNDTQNFHYERKRMKNALRSTAESMGITGGLLTLQVGPTLKQKQYWEENEASYRNIEELVLRVAVMGGIKIDRSSLSRLRRYYAGEYTPPQETAIDLLRPAAPRSLRAIFVKGRNTSTAVDQLTENDYGLFHWPTITLCSPHQWLSRFEMTRNQKCVAPWGDWRKNAKKAADSSTSEHKVAAVDATKRRANLLNVIHALGPEIATMGRVILRRFLQGEGYDVSEREVRWLVDYCKQNGVA
jgi:hypothetical protein